MPSQQKNSNSLQNTGQVIVMYDTDSVLLGADTDTPGEGERTGGDIVTAFLSYFIFSAVSPRLLVVVTSWSLWRMSNRFVSYSAQLKLDSF